MELKDENGVAFFSSSQAVQLATSPHPEEALKTAQEIMELKDENGVAFFSSYEAVQLATSSNPEEALKTAQEIMKLKDKKEERIFKAYQAVEMAISLRFGQSIHLLRYKGASLPMLSERIGVETEEYLVFRRGLRGIDYWNALRVFEIFLGAEEYNELKANIDKRIKEEKSDLEEVSGYDLKTIQGLRLEDRRKYNEILFIAGRLLYSFDEGIREEARNRLIEWYYDLIPRYEDSDKQGIADEIMMKVAMRYDVYREVIEGGKGRASFEKYLLMSLRHIDKLLFWSKVPEELRYLLRKIKGYEKDYIKKNNKEPSEAELREYVEELGWGIYDAAVAMQYFQQLSLDTGRDGEELYGVIVRDVGIGLGDEEQMATSELVEEAEWSEGSANHNSDGANFTSGDHASSPVEKEGAPNFVTNHKESKSNHANSLIIGSDIALYISAYILGLPLAVKLIGMAIGLVGIFQLVSSQRLIAALIGAARALTVLIQKANKKIPELFYTFISFPRHALTFLPLISPFLPALGELVLTGNTNNPTGLPIGNLFITPVLLASCAETTPGSAIITVYRRISGDPADKREERREAEQERVSSEQIHDSVPADPIGLGTDSNFDTSLEETSSGLFLKDESVFKITGTMNDGEKVTEEARDSNFGLLLSDIIRF
ncbi:MAG: hypothetical protein AAB267_01975, partial [Candidatus Desantisbacteria bacterium]